MNAALAVPERTHCNVTTCARKPLPGYAFCAECKAAFLARWRDA